MRIVVAPDSFGGTLSAVQAAEAIRVGWTRTAPDDQVTTVPLSDGGPGFVDVLHHCLGGRLVEVMVSGPLGEPVVAHILLVEKGGARTAYVESAQVCGLHLIPAERRDPTRATTVGVGELLLAAVDAGAQRIVVGLGGSGTCDGGAGLLAALSAQVRTDEGTRGPGVLRHGGAGLGVVRSVDLRTPLDLLGDVEVVVATDVDVPLLGSRGAAHGFASQKGATPAQVDELESALGAFARALGRRSDGKDPALLAGAGAAGGLGYALLHLGARRVPGIATVLGSVGLAERVGAADLVLTGEGRFDWQSLQGKVVSGVCGVAVEHARPVLVLAGQVEVGRREWVALGAAGAFSVADQAGSVAAAMAAPADRLADLAARVARTWSR